MLAEITFCSPPKIRRFRHTGYSTASWQSTTIKIKPQEHSVFLQTILPTTRDQKAYTSPFSQIMHARIFIQPKSNARASCIIVFEIGHLVTVGAPKRHVDPKTAQKKLTVKLKPDEEAFCGESTNRPKEQIVDIDTADAGNELAAVE
ncbi:hypothetical protein L6164_002837 [Bauhinia variegata]|uniref:Uncharacterized protein n=1 Tax=Bauhinia variegata TaxID=167791 RepID=A0ACB9PZB8_BAUVA|nr:hypothetical protein L6164_002837 [Bauhinia variegata]